MQNERELRSYIQPALSRRVIGLVLFVVMLLSIGLGVSSCGVDNTAEAVPFTAAETGDYAYFDVLAVSDWLYQSDDATYYTAADATDALITLRLNDSQFQSLQQQNDFWNLEAAPQPQPLRIYGMVQSAGSTIASSVSQVWDLGDTQTYYAIFGDQYLNATTTPGEENGSIWLLLALFSGLFGLLLLPSSLLAANCAKKCMDRLERLGLINDAAEEFLSPETQICAKDHFRLGSRFLYGKHNGAALRYEDILWCYQRVTRYYFMAVSASLLICTADGKTIQLTARAPKVKDGADDPIALAVNAIAAHNPQVLVGFTAENRKAYRAMWKQTDR